MHDSTIILLAVRRLPHVASMERALVSEDYPKMHVLYVSQLLSVDELYLVTGRDRYSPAALDVITTLHIYQQLRQEVKQ